MNKLKNNKGMTFSELLVATLIMLLVSAALVTGVALANKQFVSSIRYSEADELYSSLSSLISNELRFTDEIKTSNGKVVAFYPTTYSLSTNTPYIVSLDDDKQETQGYGQLAFGSNGSYNLILSSANYSYNMGAKINIEYIKNGNYFIVDLDIGADNTSLIDKEFTVRALNDVAESSRW